MLLLNLTSTVYALGGYYFNTDELQIPSDSNGTDGFSVFVDMHSGLTVVEDFGENGAAWGIAYGQLSLVNTNIPMTVNVRASPSPSPSVPESFNQVTVAAVAGASAAVVVGAGLLVLLQETQPTSENLKFQNREWREKCQIGLNQVIFSLFQHDC